MPPSLFVKNPEYNTTPWSPEELIAGLNTPKLLLLHWKPCRDERLRYWKKHNLCKVAGIVSSCCKSTLTSGRHLRISFYEKPPICVCGNNFKGLLVSASHLNKNCFLWLKKTFYFYSYISIHACSLHTAMMKRTHKYRKVWLTRYKPHAQESVCTYHFVCSFSPYWYWHTPANLFWFWPS